jgi:hypothetical protein
MTGHRPVAAALLQIAKDALESQVRLLDISASIWDCDALIDLAGCRFVFFSSGVRLFRQQRRESFAL